jgi:endogenous inhibitor of DNA gyrase (YacG/DUF329 family)
MNQRACKICGKPFTPANATSRLCSHACRDQARRIDVTVNCEQCGKPFTRKQWMLNRSKHFFCSHECAGVWRRSTPERFWARVRKGEGCWLWVGGAFRNGYGSFGSPGRGTHRVAWELVNGSIPEGMHVLHRCDINYLPGDITYRRCVNPAHLFLGTQADNMADMRAKGRGAKGSRKRKHA